MYQKYTAFISYRHHPLDSAVAEDVHKRLERFHVPASLRRQKGQRRLGRMFRDKAELAITSDINEDICQALASADYLIVICSTHTAESMWVQRELEEFLRTHDRSRVLTVLAEGEPKDVIPELLRWQEVTGEDGAVHRIPVEPLSCDFRGYTADKAARRTARREELPRLAAALLDCPYDALRQRQRQYQLRRLALGFSTALLGMTALTGYFFWSNLRIQENYDKALRSQSLYLSAEAMRQLDAGERDTAALLALAALPSAQQPRPLVPQAEYALSQAVSAYTVPDGASYEYIHAFDHSTNTLNFFLNEDGSRLYVQELNDTVTVWDALSFQKLFSQRWDSGALDVLLPGADCSALLLINEACVEAIDSETGEELWRYEAGENHELKPDTAVLGAGGQYLYIQDYTSENRESLLFWRLDALTGSRTPLNIPLPKGAESCSQLYRLCVSADDSMLAFTYLSPSARPDSHYDYRVAIYSIANGATVTVPHLFPYVCDLTFTRSGQLAAAAVLYPDDADMPQEAYEMDSVHVAIGLDSTDGSSRWTTFCTDLPGDADCRLHADIRPADEGGTDMLVCTMSRAWLLIRAGDGVPADILGAGGSALYTHVADGRLLGAADSGVLTLAELAASTEAASCTVASPEYKQDVKAAAMAGDVTVARFTSSSRLVLYRARRADASWQPAWSTRLALQYAGTLVPGGMLLADSENMYYMMDTDTLALRWSFQFDEEISAATLAPNGSVLHLWTQSRDETPSAVHALQLSDGSITRTELTGELNGYIYAECSLNDGRMAVKLYEDEILVLEPDGSVHRRYPMPLSVYDMQPSPDASMLLLRDSDRQLHLMSLKTGKNLPLCTVDTTDVNVQWAADSRSLVVIDAYQVALYSTDCEPLLTLPLQNAAPVSAYPAGDRLLVAGQDRYLYCYSLEDGSLLGRSKLESIYDVGLTWTNAGEYVTLSFFDYLYLIDPEDGSLLAYVTGCLGYLPEQQLFVVHKGTLLGTFRRHTLEELTKLAHSQLAGRSLSREQLLEYGLE